MKQILLTLICTLVLSACAHVKESPIVMLTTEDMRGGGTGFFVKTSHNKTYILTNAHICDGQATYVVTDYRQIPLKVVEISNFTDLCLLEPYEANVDPLELGQEPKAHDKLTVLGYGYLLGETMTEGRFVRYLPGDVLGVNNPGYATPTILPGNSGSPVLDASGKVIGVAFASAPFIGFRTLMVPLQDIQLFLKPY